MSSLLSTLAMNAGAVKTDPSTWTSLLDWANITTTWEIGLIIFGLGAQALFFSRWIVQWYASERRGESHMPVMFWWLSLAGASLLLVYFIMRGEPVGMLGQSVGWVVYSRNLYLIHLKKRITELA